jgi:hypothetical protein
MEIMKKFAAMAVLSGALLAGCAGPLSASAPTVTVTATTTAAPSAAPGNTATPKATPKGCEPRVQNKLGCFGIGFMKPMTGTEFGSPWAFGHGGAGGELAWPTPPSN